jgi:putative transposase
MSLGCRTFQCEACGLTLDRDLNAAINLGALATAEYTESYACGEDTALSTLVEAGNSAQTFERGVFLLLLA